MCLGPVRHLYIYIPPLQKGVMEALDDAVKKYHRTKFRSIHKALIYRLKNPETHERERKHKRLIGLESTIGCTGHFFQKYMQEKFMWLQKVTLTTAAVFMIVGTAALIVAVI